MTITFTNPAGDYCPDIVVTNDPLAIITNWWAQAGFEGVPTSGTGLAAAFTPTNAGVGLVNFFAQYTNASPCATNLTEVNIAETFYVVHITNQCFAPYPTNRARTTLGVAEQVNLGLTPVPPGGVTWTLSGGGVLSSATDPQVQFWAPPVQGSSTLTASFAGGSCSIAFNTVEPDGTYTDFKVEEITNNTPPFYSGVQGAAMNCTVIFNPTNVSFYNVQVKEVGEDATNLSGFFLRYYTPSSPELVHVPGDWGNLTFINSWNDDVGFHGFGNSLTWFPGEYDWDPIPVLWSCTSTTTHPLTSWTQIMTIDSTDGTSTVKKYASPQLQSTRTP